MLGAAFPAVIIVRPRLIAISMQRCAHLIWMNWVSWVWVRYRSRVSRHRYRVSCHMRAMRVVAAVSDCARYSARPSVSCCLGMYDTPCPRFRNMSAMRCMPVTAAMAGMRCMAAMAACAHRLAAGSMRHLDGCIMAMKAFRAMCMTEALGQCWRAEACNGA